MGSFMSQVPPRRSALFIVAVAVAVAVAAAVTGGCADVAEDPTEADAIESADSKEDPECKRFDDDLEHAWDFRRVVTGLPGLRPGEFRRIELHGKKGNDPPAFEATQVFDCGTQGRLDCIANRKGDYFVTAVNGTPKAISLAFHNGDTPARFTIPRRVCWISRGIEQDWTGYLRLSPGQGRVLEYSFHAGST
jgi:hypothetical protein